MSFSAEQERDLKEIEAQIGTLFTFNGQQYRGVTGTNADTETMRDAGYGQVYDLELVVRKSLFTAQPAKRDTVTIGDTTYRIERITREPEAVSMTLHLVQHT